MKNTILYTFCLWITCSLLSGTAIGQSKKQPTPYKEVDIEELKTNPQNFWSKGILFYDTFTEVPDEKYTRINKKKYYRFSTEELGDCYAEEELAEELRNAALNQEYVFSGWVVNYKKNYYVNVEKATLALVREESASGKGIDDLIHDFENSETSNLKHLSVFLKKAAISLTGLAQSKNMEIHQLLQSDAETQSKLKGLIRKSLTTIQQDDGTTANEILVEYAYFLLREKHDSMYVPNQYYQTNQFIDPLSPDIASSDPGEFFSLQNDPIISAPPPIIDPLTPIEPIIDPIDPVINPLETINPVIPTKEKPLIADTHEIIPEYVPENIDYSPIIDPQINTQEIKTYQEIKEEPKQVAKTIQAKPYEGLDKYDRELAERLAAKANGITLQPEKEQTPPSFPNQKVIQDVNEEAETEEEKKSRFKLFRFKKDKNDEEGEEN